MAGSRDTAPQFWVRDIPAVFDASAFQLLFTLLTGWLDRQELDVLRYLLEENRVLRRQLRGRRLQLTDDERRRLAMHAYELGRRRLHFRQTVSEYVAHYHHERNHQGLGNTLIEGIVPNRRQGRIRRRSRLGGLLNYYERAA